MKSLELYVLGGPNGAGKSTLSETFVPPGTDIFDGDKELAILKSQYPMTDSGTLYNAANEYIFQTRKDKAITAGTDFAFETNFRTKDVMDSVEQFKQNGYKTNLIFIGLPSVEASLNRVDLRVKAGGHFVDAENVNKNYTCGLENLINFYDRFDTVDILQSNIGKNEGFRISSLMTIKKGVITAVAPDLPDWVNKIPEAIEKKHQQQIKAELKFQQDRQQELRKGQEKGNNYRGGIGR